MESETVLRQVARLEVTWIRDQNDIEKTQVEKSSIFHGF